MATFDQSGQKVTNQTNIAGNQYNAGGDITHVEGDFVKGDKVAGNKIIGDKVAGDKTVWEKASENKKTVHRRASADGRHTRTVVLTVGIGVMLAGVAMAGIGAYLVYLGSTGTSEFAFFGQQFKSGNLGVAAIFIGAAMIVLVLRRLLKSVDVATSANARRK